VSMHKNVKLIVLLTLFFGTIPSTIASSFITELRNSLFIEPFKQTIYVDNLINVACNTYDIKNRSCKGGHQQALPSIKMATKDAIAGTLFLIRAGDYKEVLHITHSGEKAAYIAFVAYKKEKVRLVNTNSSDQGEIYGPIWIDQASYNLVSGIGVTGSVGFGRLLNAHFNIIHNGKFIESSFWKEGRGKSKRGGLYIAFSHNNKILNSYFYKGTDSLSLVHSNYNLVENNTMALAGHDIWNIKCGSFNVIRNNEFSNKNQKLGSVFDCEKNTMSWHGNGEFALQAAILDASQHNLIESNIFRDTVRYYSTSGGNGIQYAGQIGIIRFNQFYHTNAGFSLASYRSEAMYNYDNRIYNNTFHDNWCVGITVGSEIKKNRDNEFVNNILWNNQGLSKDQCSAKNAKQILFRKTKGNNWFFNNNIGSDQSDKVIGVWAREKQYSIYDYEGSYLPVQFDKNIAVNPQFVDEKKNNYRLQKSSPMIDSGVFLTAITSTTGQGSLLQVYDAKFFFDGYSIIGLKGDLVQIKGQSQTAQIVKIDYKTNTLTLNKVLTWSEGDLISLVYQGNAPDIGAFEFNLQ
jgi:hypothetical protein